MTAVVFVQSGESFVADQVSPGSTATFFIAWGTGGSSTGATETNTDVDLAAQATEADASATTEDQPSADTCRWIAILTAGTAKTIEEAGLKYATTTATGLIIRASHGGVALATDDQIQYTFTLQFSGTTT
jgi:hypothetical protein